MNIATRDEAISVLVENGMDPALAPKATDAWSVLCCNCPDLVKQLSKSGARAYWPMYCFMQGFVAGTALTNKCN